MTQVDGTVYDFNGPKKQVAIKVSGLTPKVIRFYTDDTWVYGEPVVVTVARPGEVTQPEFVSVEGFSID